MLYFHHIALYLFFISASLFTTDQEKKPILAFENPIKTDPLSPPPIPDDIRKRLFEQKEEFDEDEIKEMEMVLEAAPLKAQFIPQHLEDPAFFPACKKFRSAYFIGAPGTGKTIAAKAIAYKMSQKGWDIFISRTELVEKDRNQMCIQIRNELECIVASGKSTIIIIDDIDRLLENTDSTPNNTARSSTALWTFLDKQLKNPNIFLIGTMNSAKNLPQDFKNRINCNCISFESKRMCLNEKTLKSDANKETNAERQERYHQEKIALQKKHHKENFIAQVIGKIIRNL